LPVPVTLGAILLAVIKIERLQDLDLFLEQRVVCLFETLEAHEVAETNAPPSGLIFVARPDAARSGADRDAAGASLRESLYHSVEWQEHMRPVADAQLTRNIHSGRFQCIDFSYQRNWVDYQAITDHRRLSGMQDAARNQFQDELTLAHDDRVARIMPALIPDYSIKAVREKIDQLPFAFVSPLRT